jgi:hypothetical protein
LTKGSLQWEFGTDGTMVWRAAGVAVLNVKYSLGSGETINFTFDQPINGAKKATSKISINGDTLTATDPDGTKMTMERIK